MSDEQTILEKAADHLKSENKPDNIRLKFSEMTSEEMLLARAILSWAEFIVRNLVNEENENG